MPDRFPRFRPTGRARSAVYRLLWFGSDAFLKAANGCLFAAAGLLPLDQRQAASREEWRNMNVSKHDVDAGLSFSERQFYSKFLHQGDRVLLVGCGSGRDLLGLARLGVAVDGLDSDPALVELAQANLARHGMAGTARAGSIQAAELDGHYDAVIFTVGGYSLLPFSESRVDTLVRIRGSLSKRGRVILSYHPFTAPSRIGKWFTAVAARLAGSGWVPENGDVFWRHHLVPGVLSYRHGFAAGEVQRECASGRLQDAGGRELRRVLLLCGDCAVPRSSRIASRAAASMLNVRGYDNAFTGTDCARRVARAN